MAAQCMLWQTSPAATELETRMLDWLRQMIGLPETFAGVIQDSASGATLAALLTAREKALGFGGNPGGPFATACGAGVLLGARPFLDRQGRAYRRHRRRQPRRVPVEGERFGMDGRALDRAIRADRDRGHLPAAVVACLGGTSVGACDDIEAVAAVAGRHGLYLHVDAAWAGSAMICPEFRTLMRGAAEADSFVFNPHKWLFTNFDCSAHFVETRRG